jgi:serine protease Do
MQEVVAKAIERSDRSVVAISRVRKEAATDDVASPLPFGLRQAQQSPTDPDFIPLDYGTGVVIDGEAGLVVTTLPVLGDLASSQHFVWSQKRPFKAEVVATSPWTDLAVLKVDAEGLVSMPLGDASTLKKGHIVLALGNPYGIARDGIASASWGIVSNLGRSAPRTPTRSNDSQGRETLHHFGTLIQTDAKLALGYDGGALLNLQGEMVGLTTSLTATTRHETPAGLAIPVDATFKRVLEALKRGETAEFGFLGVGPATLSTNLRQLGHHGARVDTVIDRTPAAKVGVRQDDVITHIAGRPIYGAADLFRAVGQAAPGMKLALTVVRGDLIANDSQIETEARRSS